MSPRRLDLKNLKCPLPALKTRKYISHMRHGDEVIIETTDPLSAIDIPHAITQAKAQLLAQQQQGDIFHFHVRYEDLLG
jgi:tRNA 2-thiouridine synthesizing protein A